MRETRGKRVEEGKYRREGRQTEDNENENKQLLIMAHHFSFWFQTCPKPGNSWAPMLNEPMNYRII